LPPACDQYEEYSFLIFTYNNSRLAKVSTSLLLTDVVSRLQAAASGQQVPKFLLYSGHDLGPMMPLLAALEAWDGVWTGFASMITMELLQATDSKELRVRATYNGDVLQVCGVAAARPAPVPVPVVVPFPFRLCCCCVGAVMLCSALRCDAS
jgi:hypothetical protein